VEEAQGVGVEQAQGACRTWRLAGSTVHMSGHNPAWPCRSRPAGLTELILFLGRWGTSSPLSLAGRTSVIGRKSRRRVSLSRFRV
jgi:hypothetical protein